MRVASEIPLPELLPWTGAPDTEPDLHFRYGDVPDHLEGANYIAPVFQTKGDCYLLSIPGSARFLVRNGREVVVERTANAGAEHGAILSGTIQGVIYHQRGLFPLHASTVLMNGHATAIAAPSGTGKSTLAAALVQRGATVLGDDICVLRLQDNGAFVIPTYPRLRLWRDSLTALNWNSDGLPRAIYGKEKYFAHDTTSSAFPLDPVPLGDLVLLTRQPSLREPSLERLRGLQAVQGISRNIHVRRPAGALGFQQRLFLSATKLASQVRVWHLIRPENLDQLHDLADIVCGLPERAS
jgi:hypothetical protein